jgi:hypothetical protein
MLVVQTHGRFGGIVPRVSNVGGVEAAAS